ncbi:hypothetical protein YPC_0700 [Yersinia pestis biovar Medievalis str. Harbin 35]|nr:hypothetical protein YPC_0700 [Yersinia pestis biovar Medievalis str. Harbin 35]EEO82615.1 hypothetical protein YPF_0584 [Yersinia pestis biovar Orientalis str. India 195]
MQVVLSAPLSGLNKYTVSRSFNSDVGYIYYFNY